jgi:hypothetical protein
MNQKSASLNIHFVSNRRTAIRQGNRRDRQTRSSSFTTGAPAPKEMHQMSRNSSTVAANVPVALHPATLRASFALVVIAAFTAFAVRAAGLTFGF